MADSRKYFPVNHFAGVVKSYHPRAIPDDKVSDVLNVLFEFGKAKRRYGYNSIGANTPLDGIIMDIIYYEQLRTGDNFTVVLTTTSAYAYDSSTGNFSDITPLYNTGVISIDTDAATGTGTTWLTAWSGKIKRLKLGTNDPDVNSISFTGNIGGWVAAAASDAMSWCSVAYGNGVFISVASNSAQEKIIMRSTDNGATWSTITKVSNNVSWVSVSYGNGVFVAASSSGGTQKFMRSTDDGATWSVILVAGNSSSISSVSYGNGVWVAVCNSAIGGDPRVLRSTDDGTTWTSIEAAEENSWQSVSYGNGIWIAVSNDGINRVMRSADDGITWASVVVEALGWKSVAYGNGVFVAISTNGVNRIMRSTDDGVTWTPVVVPEYNIWRSICYGNNTFVAVSSDGTNRIMKSIDDGITWTLEASTEQNSWYSVCYGNGIFLSVSIDGTNRIEYFSPTVITSVSSTAGLYVGLELTSSITYPGTRIKAISWAGSTITTDIPFLSGGTGISFQADISDWFNITTVGSNTTLSISPTGSTTGDTTNTSAVVVNVPDTSILHVGMGVDGTGIAAETSILSIDSATQITLSKAATATNTAVALTLGVLVDAAHDINYVVKHCFNGDADNLFSSCMPYTDTIDDKILVFTNGVDKIKKWDGSGAISDLTMTGITCDWAKCVGYFGSSLSEHTIIANMNDGSTNLPHQIMVSDAGDPEAYSGAYYELLTSNDEITALKALGTRLVIYKRKSISLAWATPEGGNDDPLDLDQNKITEVGCPAPRTIQDFGSYHLFLGLSGDSVNVYAFNGINVETIGSDIYADLKSKVRLSMVHRSFAFTLQSRSLYCLFVPTGTSDYPDLVYVFNYVEKHWTIWEFTDMMMAYGFMRQEYNPTWAEIHALTTLWPAMEMRWSDLKFYSQDAFPLVGDAAGYVYDFRDIYDDDDGDDIDAFFVTKDYPLNDTKHTFKLLEGVVGYKGQEDGNDIQFQASVDFGNNYCNPITIEQDTSTDVADVHDHEYAETICNFYEKGRQARFKLNNVDGADFEIEGIIIGYTDEQGLTK
jgi:hypothetical protein